MTPEKVIPIDRGHTILRERQKRQAKKVKQLKAGKPATFRKGQVRRAGLIARLSQWLMTETTRGTVLLAGLVAGITIGAFVAGAVLMATRPDLASMMAQ